MPGPVSAHMLRGDGPIGFRVLRAPQSAGPLQLADDNAEYADAVLTNTIVDVHVMSRRSYGSPRVHAELTLGMEIRNRKSGITPKPNCP